MHDVVLDDCDRICQELWKQEMKRPKLRKQEVEKGLGKNRRKNMEVDEMGDLRGRIHVGKQDLGKLQTRKMKGLKKGFSDGDGEDGESDEDESGGEEPARKRRKSE